MNTSLHISAKSTFAFALLSYKGRSETILYIAWTLVNFPLCNMCLTIELNVRCDACFSDLQVLTVYMTSDNDVSEFVSSSGSGCPSPVPAAITRCTTVAVTAKGILVHNNKKSTNTNHVSFVAHNSLSTASASSSSLTLSPPLPPTKWSKKKQRQLPQRSDGNDQIPYHARTGRRLTGFGVKSYLHEFYDDPEGRASFQVRTNTSIRSTVA